MNINKYGEVVLNSNDVFTGIYSGKINSIDNLLIDDQEELEKFNAAIKLNFEQFREATFYKEQNIEITEFDKSNQQIWFMPDEYKQMDIEGYLVHVCPKQNYERLIEELVLFRQHNMIDVLRYLKYFVDTMREHKIVWGVGRGSSVASYCLYLLGVHKIDSVKYKLDINEFLK
jgi:DNA polymerase III alpha subunit